MYRKYPKKEGKTFKYKSYSKRLFKRLGKVERYICRDNKKSIARMLVHQMKYADDLEELETRLIECESTKQKYGFLD